MISLTDKDGNSYGDSSIVVIGANGKVKPVSTGGGSPTGPAGGDLSGTYPNPSVVWNNGIPTYNSLYFPIPTGTTVQYIRGDGSLATFPAIPAQYNPTAGTGISITGAYPNQTIANTLTLTTTGTSGAATLVGSTLNIPQYSGGGGSSNFSIISLSATDSTAVTGTTANAIVSAILIPANTFSSTGIIDIAARYFKTGTLGSQTVRMYVNTSASLTGATLVANFYSGSNRQVGAWRTANIASNTINFLSISGTFSSDLASINAVGTSATFNTSVDNYIIFSVQLTSTSDSCVLQFHKILRYV